MPIARFQMPDGKIGRFEVPDGTTADEAHRMISDLLPRLQGGKQNGASSDTQSQDRKPDRISNEDWAAYQQRKDRRAAGQLPEDPTVGMSTMAKFNAGLGTAIADPLIGLTNAITKPFRSGDMNVLGQGMNVDEYKKLTAPLRESGAGLVGSVAGSTLLAPLMMVPGGSTLAGSAVLGGALGALQPVGEKESPWSSPVTGMVAGGLGGVAGQIAGRIPEAAGGAIKATFVDPFTQKGQRSIVGKTLNRFAGDSRDQIIQNLRNPAASMVPGSRPTVAELAQSPSMSGFQLSAKNVMPEVKDQLMRQEYSNTAARLDALQKIAGEPGKRDFFEANRKQVSDTMFGNAFKEIPGNTPQIKEQVDALMQLPDFKKALAAGQRKLLNEGGKLEEANTIKLMDYTRRALGDRIDELANAGRKDDARVLGGIKQKVMDLLSNKDFSPGYTEALSMHAQNSRPINQMDVGEMMVNKLRPALMDFSEGAVTRVKANEYAKALRDAEQTAKKATGFSGATLENTMEPEQLSTMKAIARDLARKATSEDMAKTVGSTTAQNLAGQHALRGLLGPLGMPEGVIDSTLTNSIAKVLGPVYRNAAESRIQNVMAKALSDPQYAAELMQSSGKSNQLSQLLRAMGRSGATGAGSAIGIDVNR